MNLISRTHNFCERREYAFNVLPEYLIITPSLDMEMYEIIIGVFETDGHCGPMISVSVMHVSLGRKGKFPNGLKKMKNKEGSFPSFFFPSNEAKRARAFSIFGASAKFRGSAIFYCSSLQA